MRTFGSARAFLRQRERLGYPLVKDETERQQLVEAARARAEKAKARAEKAKAKGGKNKKAKEIV